MRERLPNPIRYNRQKNRRNNDLIAAMYALYQTGKTLQQVGKVYGTTRQSVFSVFRSRGYALRARIDAPSRFVGGIKFTKSGKSRKGLPKRWRATRRDKSLLLSHYIWEKHFGPVPAGHGIRYKDGDEDNNSVRNLECVPIREISHRKQRGTCS